MCHVLDAHDTITPEYMDSYPDILFNINLKKFTKKS